MWGVKQQCRICGHTLPLSDFYEHPKNRNGRDTACKTCVKARMKDIREQNIDYYRAYDRKRYRNQPHRKDAARRSAASPAGIASRMQSLKRSRKDNPEKWKARNAVNNAIRDGRLVPEPCFFCGSDEKLHAHHEDYNHPLDVVWLCPACHGKLHTLRGDFRRAG